MVIPCNRLLCIYDHKLSIRDTFSIPGSLVSFHRYDATYMYNVPSVV